MHVSSKMISIIKTFYINFECSVIVRNSDLRSLPCKARVYFVTNVISISYRQIQRNTTANKKSYLMDNRSSTCTSKFRRRPVRYLRKRT